MRRAWLTVLIASVTALGVLGLPAGALAGTFTWSLPGDFTVTAPGANPDHDNYGATPWSYRAGPSAANSSGLMSLATFATGIDGGLAGWTDSRYPNALVAANPTGSAISNGVDTFPAGQLALTPPQGGVVAIGWTSPLPAAATVTVTGSVNPDAPLGCLFSGYSSWSLDQNGSPLATSATSANLAVTTTVPSGGSIYFAVSPSLIYSAACVTAGVSLQIQAGAGTAPHVTLTSPANGSLITAGTPTFSGSASIGFGMAKQVRVRIYAGATASGTPAQTLTTNASGGGYAVTASATLGDGVYTAQADQQDLASPPDAGFSSPTSFRINNAAAQIQLASPGRGPLQTATPTLTGVAGTGSGDASSVSLIVYPGSDTAGTPVRYLGGAVGSQGQFTAQVTPGLPDGQYTAIAAQDGPGSSVGFSNPVVFRIKLHPPAVTLTAPAAGSNTSRLMPVFAGAAGATVDDNPTVTVRLYAGGSARGKALGMMTVTRLGASWSGTWSHALKLGLYTAVASQKDDVGHTGTSRGDTFLIVPPPSVIGAGVTISRAGVVAVPVSCAAPSGQNCTGDVLVKTVRSFRPVAGGPVGRLSVMFAYVTIPGGHTMVVHQPMQRVVRRALRHTRLARVTVVSLLSTGGGQARTSTATRLVRVGS